MKSNYVTRLAAFVFIAVSITHLINILDNNLANSII